MGPIAFRRGLVNQHDRLSLVIVGFGEETSADKRGLEDMKQVGRRHSQLGGRRFTSGSNPARDVERRPRYAAVQQGA